MKNTFIIILVIFAISIVGVYVFMNRTDHAMPGYDSKTQYDKENVADSTSMAKTDETSMMKNDEDKMMQMEGKYAPFSPELLASSGMTRRVLFFYANWCPTCKPANESFTNNVSQLPADVTLIRVNYNDNETDQEEKDLAKKYGVTYQHTFVQIDDKGNSIAKWNGGQLDELLSNIK